MALKKLDIATNAAPAASSTEIRTFDIDGSDVTKYNGLVIQKAVIEAEMAKIGTSLREIGTTNLLGQAVMNPTNAPSSVVLKDEKSSAVRFTFQNKYSVVDPEAAESLFTNLGADANDFIQFTAVAKFSNDVFLIKKGCERTIGTGRTAENLVEGDFSAELFNLYSKAIEQATAYAVSKGLLPVGTVSPLTSSKVANTKPTFHENRFTKFPNVEQQLVISRTCKNTTSLTPVVAQSGVKGEAPTAPNVINFDRLVGSKGKKVK